jgi:hypothetical protein
VVALLRREGRLGVAIEITSSRSKEYYLLALDMLETYPRRLKQ